jgi:hypothetical protein
LQFVDRGKSRFIDSSTDGPLGIKVPALEEAASFLASSVSRSSVLSPHQSKYFEACSTSLSPRPERLAMMIVLGGRLGAILEM